MGLIMNKIVIQEGEYGVCRCSESILGSVER